MVAKKKLYKIAQKQRLQILDLLYQEAHKTYANKKDQLRAKTNTANLLLASWAFVFGGMVGLFQANILHSANMQSILIMLLIMSSSMVLCVFSTIASDYEASAPNVSELWKEYEYMVKNGNIDNNSCTSIKERVTFSLVKARVLSQHNLEKKSKRLTIASVLLLVELGLLLLYVIYPDLVVLVKM